MSPGDNSQCRALTESGERCSRPAEENGFCHQHGPDDETVDESELDDSADSNDTETMPGDSDSELDIEAVRERVKDTAENVVGRPLDGITSINRDDENWRVAVEVIERKGVPDSQDILGRYELILTEDLTVSGYERTHRFRRDDTEQNV